MEKFVTLLLAILVACGVVLYYRKDSYTSEYDAYLINLRRRSDRLENFKKYYYESDLSKNNLIVIEAIDGSDVKQIEEFMPESTKKILRTGRREKGEELSAGMIGCYLSHYKVWEEFLKSGKPMAFVFEDDSKIVPNFGAALNNLPSDWDLVMIGVQSCMECPDFDSKFTKLNSFYGAGGYLINRQGARKMIQNKESPIEHQIDILMAKLCKEGKVNVYSVKDNLVHTESLGSDVQMHIG
jgi:GR25 family glycosyltransferase involved in LPS biosynthesis